MKNGILADAEVLDVRSPPRSGDSDTSVLSEVVLKYVDDRGNERTFTHSTSNIFDVGDEPRELILFDPTNPKKAFPIDEFYKKVEIDGRGEIRDVSPGGFLLTIGAVLLLLAPHVVYFVPGTTISGEIKLMNITFEKLQSTQLEVLIDFLTSDTWSFHGVS